MLESCRPTIFARKAKGVDIVFTYIFPALKRDTQFKSTLDCGNKFALVDTKQLMQSDHGRDGRFTNSDGANFI